MLTRRKLLNQAALSGAALAAARFGLAAKVAVDPHAIEKFRASLAGRLIVPGDAAYDGARGVVYVNPANDKRPAMIAKCARDSDVARCVEFARTHDLPIAVRSGGHSFLGWGTCNGGFVIDVSPLKSVSIDATARTVDAGCGLTAQELVASAARFGLAPVLGECATVGISGLTLGGGVGWLSGRYGAASDNLLSANLTTADGGAATVDQQSNPDLFWAIRGGGGNFGIATSLRLKLHPIGDVLAGGFTYELPRARAVLQYFRDFMATAPDELQTLAYLTPEQGGALNIIFVHSGDHAEGGKFVDAFRTFAAPVRDTVQRRQYVETFTMSPYGEFPLSPYGAIRGSYIDRLSDAVIDVALDRFAQSPGGCAIGFDHYMHGEVCRIPVDATAFELRAPGGVLTWVIPGWSDAAAARSTMAWADATWDALQPFTGGRAYANYMSVEAESATRSAYGANYARLSSIKRRYDPANVFRRNANIAPT